MRTKILLQTSGRTASSTGLPTPSSKRNVGIGLLPTELKKSNLETIGEPVVGKTSCRRVEQLENALDDMSLLTIPRIMEAKGKLLDACLNLD